jgi:hypothetical protein
VCLLSFSTFDRRCALGFQQPVVSGHCLAGMRPCFPVDCTCTSGQWPLPPEQGQGRPLDLDFELRTVLRSAQTSARHPSRTSPLLSTTDFPWPPYATCAPSLTNLLQCHLLIDTSYQVRWKDSSINHSSNLVLISLTM